MDLKHPPAVTAIVLNWNKATDTLACLRSLDEQTYPNCEALVVDNGSQDGSVARVRRRFPQVTVLELAENLGYAGGNNRGIEYALRQGCEYVWLLNDDTTVAPDALQALMAEAQASPGVGFFGPMVYMLDDPHRILSAGGVFADRWQPQHRGIGQLDQGQLAGTSEVDYLSGCALLVSRKAIEALGMLDEDFFAYYEDVDWCYRAKQAGFGVLFVPKARVWHPDTTRRDVNSPLVTYYMSRNHLLFAQKHRLGTLVMLSEAITYLLRVINWSIRPKWRHKRAQRDALLCALLDLGLKRFGRSDRLA